MISINRESISIQILLFLFFLSPISSRVDCSSWFICKFYTYRFSSGVFSPKLANRMNLSRETSPVPQTHFTVEIHWSRNQVAKVAYSLQVKFTATAEITPKRSQDIVIVIVAPFLLAKAMLCWLPQIPSHFIPFLKSH